MIKGDPGGLYDLGGRRHRGRNAKAFIRENFAKKVKRNIFTSAGKRVSVSD